VGQTKLFAVDVKTGKVTALTGEGHVSGFSVGGSRPSSMRRTT
jgi:hypothetical protein